MRTITLTLSLVLMTVYPTVVFAVEEAAGGEAASTIGISNLILILGIGAILVIGFTIGVLRAGNQDGD